MSVEDLPEWCMSSSFLAEAEYENIVNHTLEVAFSIEQNAIQAAIESHGLGLVGSPSPSTTSTGPDSSQCSSSSSSSATKSASEDEENELMQPPVRRQRMESMIQSPSAAAVAGTTAEAGNYQQFMSLAYVYSESYQNTANQSNNNNDQGIDLNELAMKKTIDNLGLRRTY